MLQVQMYIYIYTSYDVETHLTANKIELYIISKLDAFITNKFH